MKTLYSLIVLAMLFALLSANSYAQTAITDQQKLEYIRQVEQAKMELTGKASTSYSEAIECFTSSIYSRPSTNFTSAYSSAEGPGFQVYTNYNGLTSPISGKLRFWGLRLYYSGSWSQCNTEPMPFKISFHIDNNGMPGAEIYNFLVDASALPTGETLAGFPIWEWEVNIPINLNLPNGWLSIQSRQSAGNCWFLWLNAPDAVSGVAYRWNGTTWQQMQAATGFCIGTSPVLTNDVGISAILSPESGTNLGMEDVTVRVYNYGTAVQNVIPVYFTLDGGTPNYEVITTPIQSGEYLDYTFTTQVDLSAYGLYEIESCTSLAGDINTANDCNTKMVENFSPSLCTPVYSYGCGFGDGFTFFDIDNQINNASGCDDLNGPGWSQYLGLPPAFLEPGMTYDFNMSTGYGNNNATVWIDFNDDQVFTNDEKVLDCRNMELAGQLYTFQGTIPPQAQTGQHLMRARTNWVQCADDPCAQYTYGEAEDYYVTIGSTNGDLEGYVYEFGTTTPVVGALVELAGTNFSTLSDNTGFYSIVDIPEGLYDALITHPDYCEANYTGIEINGGNTTIQDFELTWAEIAVNPAQTLAVAIPGNTVMPTQIEITNNGTCDLVYNIEVTEVSETFGGPAPENEEVIASGKEIPISQVKGVPVSVDYSAIDAGTPFEAGLTFADPDPTDGEEIFGSAQNTYGPLPRTRGNFYEVTSTTTLIEHKFWLNATASTNMLFCVWESPSKEGTYNLISASDVSPQGPGGPGWYSSGPLNVTLQAGYYYIIAASWDGNLNYYNEQNISPYPIPASFGSLIEGCGWNWSPPIGYPPAASFSVSGLLGAPVAYYQTIVTSTALDWFHLNWYSGTVAPGATEVIPGEFSSIGYSLGTIKTADLAITSNAHPNKTETHIDVIMEVATCTPTYSAGCTYGDGLEYFDIDGQYDNTTGCDNNAGTGWSQYLGLNADLMAGLTYTVTASTGYPNQNLTIWVDFNDNLALEGDEVILDCANLATAGMNYTFNATIPATAAAGPHLLRAMANWGPTDPCPFDPCGSFVYGETEDYIVTILENAPEGDLEGYVYEFGSNIPVAGALVELVATSFSAITDNTGFYSITGIPAGFYDATVTHPDYCQADFPGVEIISGNTTIQDFELTWAEIVTNPAQTLAVMIPGNTVMPTQIEITNNGTCDLVYDISVTEVSETFGGPAPENEEVIASGKEIPLSKVKGVPVSFDYSAIDAGTPFEAGLTFADTDPMDGEEIFGSAQNQYGPLPRTRGNFYEVTNATTLKEHRLWLNATASTNMMFCVWESAAKEGTYSLISASDVSPQGPGGPGWYSSGPLNVALQAGYYYIIAASWDGNLNYYNEQNISPYPIPASFGSLVEACGWNWSPPIGYPPAASLNVSGLPGAPVAYYQTIVTSSALDWFHLNWYSGTVAPGATEVIPGEFSSIGYSLGTVKTADLAITSNAHPNKTETHLDVIMQVATCTPSYSVGCTYGDGLIYFDIDGQYDNTTACDNNAGTGWSQYLGLNANLMPGLTYPVTASTGYSDQNLTIWIDFNDNLVLEADEVILECENLPTVGSNYTFNTTIPASATAGPHLLRAMANWQPTDPCPFDPCGSFTYGETEDYMVTIQEITLAGDLEGYVLETGTGLPVEGATVEVIGGAVAWFATTDISGYYLIPGILAGNWDVKASYPDYCEEIIAGVLIENGMTTTQDFNLTWAEIATDPVQEISVVIPENTLEPAQLAITNNGSCDLVYDIMITELTEVFGGPANGNEKVIAYGNEIPLSQVTGIPGSFDKNALDSEMPFTTNPFAGKSEPSDGEEIFGSDQNQYGPLPRTRGNFYEITTATTLTEHRLWLNATGTTNMIFCIWESPSKEGTYTLVSASDVSPQGPGGPGWYSSGLINVPLQAGYYYLIACAWDGNLNYYNEQNISPYPVPASFGYLIEACGWNWAPPIGYPPASTQTVSGLLGAPVAYYQTIVTNTPPDWFQLDWYSGTVPPGATEVIPGHFNSTGYPLGTLKTAELKINSNAHPNKTETILDVSMLVDEGFNLDLKVFLEGPFDPGTGFMNTWLNTFGYIPLNQPYNPPLPYYGNSNPVWLYNGTESATSIPAGVVDWILLEIRDAVDAQSAVYSTIVDRIPAFLKFDGTVTGLDGNNPPKFTDPVLDGLFVVVHHRNHLGVMNPDPLIESGNSTYTWDYSSGASQVYNGTVGHVELSPGIWGMAAGDGNADRQVNNQDKLDVWAVDAAQSGYLGGDFSLNGTCNNGDKNDIWAPNVGRSSQVPVY